MEKKKPVTNGVSHSPRAKAAADNARYQLLSQGESKILRRAMIEAVSSQFDGNVTKMADKLGITTNGLYKALNNAKGAISRRTQAQFIKLTGWNPAAKPQARPKPQAGPKPATGEHAPTKSRLSHAEAKAFRAAIIREVENGDSVPGIAEGMRVSPSTLGLILNGRGSTYETRDRFEKYIVSKREARQDRPSGVVAHLRPTPKRTAPPAIEEALDLYGIAARLLAAGRKEEAYFLCVVARAFRLVSIETLTHTLAALTPIASTG